MPKKILLSYGISNVLMSTLTVMCRVSAFTNVASVWNEMWTFSRHRWESLNNRSQIISVGLYFVWVPACSLLAMTLCVNAENLLWISAKGELAMRSFQRAIFSRSISCIIDFISCAIPVLQIRCVTFWRRYRPPSNALAQDDRKKGPITLPDWSFDNIAFWTRQLYLQLQCSYTGVVTEVEKKMQTHDGILQWTIYIPSYYFFTIVIDPANGGKIIILSTRMDSACPVRNWNSKKFSIHP